MTVADLALVVMLYMVTRTASVILLYQAKIDWQAAAAENLGQMLDAALLVFVVLMILWAAVPEIQNMIQGVNL